MTSPISVSLYLLATSAFFIDLLDVMLRVYLRRRNTRPGPSNPAAAPSSREQMPLRPFAILASIHNLDQAGLDRFLTAMAPHLRHLWVIDDASTDDTWERLERCAVRSIRGQQNRQKPAAIKALLAALPPWVETIVVVDPDTRLLNSAAELQQIVFEFQQTGMAAVCPRITIKRDGLLSRFQQLEYCLSFALGRQALGDTTITPGIAMYRRDALEYVLDRHSLSVYAEDLENTFLLLLNGERIYYDDRLIVETEGMTGIRRLFSQRVGWSFGLIKVYAQHWRALMRSTNRGFTFTYQYIVYMGILVLALHPLKLIGVAVLTISALNAMDNLAGLQIIGDTAATNPLYAVAMYVKYTVLMAVLIPVAVPRGSRRYVLPVLPLYLFYNVWQIAPATVGYLNWITQRLWKRRVYHDHYQSVVQQEQ